MSLPCPYPGCKDVRAHPRPHLMEAAFIEKLLDKAREEGRRESTPKPADAMCPTCHHVIVKEAHGGEHPSAGDHDPALHVAAAYS